MVAKREEPRSYDILNEKGNLLRINRRHLLPCKVDEQPTIDGSRDIIEIEDDTPGEENMNSTNANDEGRHPGSATESIDTPQQTSTDQQSTRTRCGRLVRKPIRYR